MTRHWNLNEPAAASVASFCLDSLLVGRSAPMRELKDIIAVAAPSDVSVLVRGDTGVGKELVARGLHLLSGRKGELVAVNCAAIPADLLEAELFGHEKGAFTGAEKQRIGRIEQARGGTLFLDEIGDMPADLQAKILRVLETRRVQRLGGNGEIEVDFRLVTATHRGLMEQVRTGRFREDLYYRIAVVPISVPSLADRVEDVPELLEAMAMSRRAVGAMRAQPVFTEGALRVMSEYRWPGNVRELRNVFERASVMFAGAEVTASDMRDVLLTEDPIRKAAPRPGDRGNDSDMLRRALAEDGSVDFRRHLQAVEIELIEMALAAKNGCVSHAAKALRLQRTTLIEKMRKLCIDACRT